MIQAIDGTKFFGENNCENPQSVCPRVEGEDYTKCKSVCSQGEHAEIKALKAAGDKARGSAAVLYGHYYICEPCGSALRARGVRTLTVDFSGIPDYRTRREQVRDSIGDQYGLRP